jgi:hypothetical protein
MALNPLSNQEYEQAFIQWATALMQVANAGEQLAEYSDATLTEPNRTNGTLVQGFQGNTPVPWTTDQLAAAQAMGQLARSFTTWMRTASGTPARSPLQRLQSVVRTVPVR